MADGDEDGVASKTKQCYGNVDVLNVVTTIIQNGNRSVECAPMLASLKLDRKSVV